jgi:hypothetical protein
MHILYNFNPPWLLGLLFPLGLLDFVPARLLWLVVQVGLLLFCTDRLWQLYGGRPERRVVAWLLCLGFFPTLQLLSLGQFSVLILAGLVGFLLLQEKHPVWAGAALALTLTKPHLAIVFWVAFGLWCWHRRRWAILLGTAGAVAGATLVAWLCNPNVIGQYVAMWGRNPTTSWIPPTPGSLLRFLLGAEHVWLMFLFPALGMTWAAWYYVRHRHRWDWAERLPVLLLACFLTAAYGWAYDQVILLPVVVQGAIAVLRRPMATAGVALAVYLGLSGLAVTMNVCRCEEYLFFWIAPALLIGYLLLRPHAPLAPRHSITFAPSAGSPGSSS